MYKIILAFKGAVKLFASHRARTFLSMLGIIIGTAGVVIINAVGAGAQNLILNQVKSVGSDLIGIMPGGSDGNEPPPAVMGITITTLKIEDLKNIQKDSKDLIVEAAGYVRGIESTRHDDAIYTTNISGVTAGYLSVEGGDLENGIFFDDTDEKSMARVAVLGSVVARELFGDENAIGKTVKIKNINFKIIGVMSERGTVAFQNYDDQIFIPLLTMQKLISAVDHLGFIRVKVKDENRINETIARIEDILRAGHNIDDKTGDKDDFTVRAAAEALDVLGAITDGVRYFLSAAAALALVVGGIGIMNITLSGVLERINEIGLRKALGARRRDIVMQFLLETIILSGGGGILGIFFGVIIAFAIFIVAHNLGYSEWIFSVSLTSSSIAFFSSALIGLIFGIYPAKKAAALNPVEALRYE